jgi:hypothetical protein
VLLAHAATLFLSAALIFVVEPLFARMVLPLLGGTPAVWATCMVFFQAALLAGYGYAHVATRWLGTRSQAILHLMLLASPAIVLPIALPGAWAPDPESPTRSLLGVLGMRVGLPFFVLAATGPLLQSWFARLGHASSKDPYFLYAASNAGSLLGLLSYPAALEPLLRLDEQSRLWTAGYGVYTALFIVCAVALIRHAPATHESHSAAVAPRLAWSRRLRWIGLAAVPSSVMLGVTTYMTTDIGAVPLLWVIPLALYLLTFIVAFSRKQVVAARSFGRAFPVVMVLLIVVMYGIRGAGILAIPFHLAAFFALALVCHRALAADRPVAAHLTAYYFLMSLGGVLGGLFNALLAPVIFTSIAEYPIALVAGCLLLPVLWPLEHTKVTRIADIAVPLSVLVAGWVVLRRPLGAEVRLVATAGLGLAIYSSSWRPLRFGAATAAVFFAGASDPGTVLHAERSFFAVSRVTRAGIDPAHPASAKNPLVNLLLHGTTNHGAQRIDPDTLEPVGSREPMTYFTRGGPVGQVFAAVGSRARTVGIVGLGVGVMAAYAESGQRFTYYEIDPVVIRVAEDARWFTYLHDARARGASVDIVLGDARLTIAKAPRARYDVMFLDAFSSDAVPVHLVTKEAVALYLERLAPHGLLALHVSNRYLDLPPMLCALARESRLVPRASVDDVRPGDEVGKTLSQWVVMARSEEDLGALARDERWREIDAKGTRAWTDGFSNLIGLIRFN